MLVCATFPLIWVGGLVTTQKAGMAVPDWPSTYGYNLFLYPWQTWLFGPYDLFLEHGHRILGAVVGMVAIGLLVSILYCDARKHLIILAVIALIAVIFQGLLGGGRVIQDEILLAKIHGCFGPLFFMLAVAIKIVMSKRWNRIEPLPIDEQTQTNSKQVASLQRLAVSTTLFAYLQLMLGAQIRHISPMTSHGSFRIAVVFHVFVAFVVLVHVLLLTKKVWEQPVVLKYLRRATLIASILVIGQICLGLATYTAKYNWPAILPGGDYFAGLLIEAESFTQTMVVTGHVAAGSLILAVTTTAALYCFKYYPSEFRLPHISKTTLRGVVA